MYMLFAPGVFEALQHFGIAAAIFIMYAVYTESKKPYVHPPRRFHSIVNATAAYEEKERRRQNRRRLFGIH